MYTCMCLPDLPAKVLTRKGVANLIHMCYVSNTTKGHVAMLNLVGTLLTNNRVPTETEKPGK